MNYRSADDFNGEQMIRRSVSEYVQRAVRLLDQTPPDTEEALEILRRVDRLQTALAYLQP